MNIDMIIINAILFVMLLRLGKALIPLRGSFLVPASSDFTMASALVAFACCPSALPAFMLFASLLLSLLSKRGSVAVIYLKVVAYTLSLLALNLVPYSYYEMVQSFVTGFIRVNDVLLGITAITLIVFAIYMINYNKVLFTIFDPEYARARGLNPEAWNSLVLLLAVLLGASLTFSHGFLLAHVVSLSVLLLGYSVRTAKAEAVLTALFLLSTHALSIYISASYAVSATTLALLLLWKTYEKKLSHVWTPHLREAQSLSRL
jgi:zinc transport system permease protein